MRCFLVVIFASVLPVWSYDEALAKKLVFLSDAAYCGDDDHGGAQNITEWTCAPCGAGALLSNVQVFENQRRQTFGFTGVTEGWDDHRYIVVSLRGSVLTQNYIDDNDMKQIASPSGRAGMVHRGMYQSFAAVKVQMLDQVQTLLQRFAEVKRILVTGHSLGAAQAVYGADELAAKYPSMQVIMYSFGTPKAGDFTFAQRLNATPNLDTWAVTHRADNVPICGIESWPCRNARDGYNQIFQTIWYPEDLVPTHFGKYVICDDFGEDPHCEDSLLDNPKLLNWDDHNLYLGHSMWCCDGGVHGTSGDACPFPFSLSRRSDYSQVVAFV